MIQQINLYQRVEKKQNDFLLFKNMVKICIATVAVLILPTLYGLYRHLQVEDELEVLKIEQERKGGILKTNQGKLTPDKTRDELSKEIEVLEAEKSKNVNMLSTLQKIEFEQSKGFSGYLQALSHQAITGVWINKFSIKTKEKVLSFEGTTVSAELVPKLIEGFSKEPAFSGKSFQGFKMVGDENNKLTKFYLETKLKKAGDTP